jgi:hypothetical protein
VIVISGEYVRETDDALLVEVDGEEHWFPKSQIDYTDGVLFPGDEIDVEMPSWLAEKKGLD